MAFHRLVLNEASDQELFICQTDGLGFVFDTAKAGHWGLHWHWCVEQNLRKMTMRDCDITNIVSQLAPVGEGQHRKTDFLGLVVSLCD